MIEFGRSFVTVALLVSASCVNADAWDEFVGACLVPLEEVRLGLPDHFEQVGAYKNDGDTFSEFALSDGAKLRVSDREVWPQWCALFVEGDARAVQARFAEWSERIGPERGYVSIEPSETGAVSEAVVAAFRSDGWREPRLDVILFVHPEQNWLSVRVADTNLESRG